MCKRFEEVLNKDIKLLVEILEIREFTAFADRAHKVEELKLKESFSSKNLKNCNDRVTTSTGYSGREQGYQRSYPRSSTPSVTSVGSVGNLKLKYKHCNKFHHGECWSRSGVCFGCCLLDHFLRDCPERVEKEIEPAPKLSNPIARGRPPCYPGNVSGSRGTTKDKVVRSKAQALARTYVRAREDASVLDVITGQFVMVDKVCKNCPLVVKGYCFLVDFMLLPFDEFDVILGMD
ncbi:uncharacterized protein [Gossypium hirsutum]|uniref:Gag-Pol polyprotein n=1 Tax=Gossypium hirsutum TaxID=3635 RepID=A0ABM2Z5P2_GOSHI|nr:uncharacterized protein LOC121210026 [Gossypium hirsutum]